MGTLGPKVNEAPELTFSIDGGAETRFVSRLTTSPQFNQLFFRSPVLADGAHTVVVKFDKANADLIYLDYFVVVTGTNAGNGVTTRVTSTSTTTTTSTSPTPTPPAPPPTVKTTAPVVVPSPTPGIGAGSNQASTNTSTTANIGAIAGGIVGVIVLIFIIIFGYMLWRRKQRKELLEDGSSGSPTTCEYPSFYLAISISPD